MKASTPALARAERFLERTLRLEHGANLFPLIHVFFYYTFFLVLVVPGFIQSLFLEIPLWILLVLLNYSLTIGIMHMHSHRPLFTSARHNRLLEFLLCVPSCVSFPVVKYAHTYIHHTFDNGPKDFTSTHGYESGWKAVWYWVRYSWLVTGKTGQGLFARDAHPYWRNLRPQYVRDSLITIFLFCVCFFLNPKGMLWVYLFPMVVTHVSCGYFAWVTHAPAKEGLLNGSVNTVNNVMGLFIHNQGYHAVHHRYPAIHWTDIPGKLELMLQVGDLYIVPYWVVLPSAVRILHPVAFVNDRFGKDWKSRYQKREGVIRLRSLPYFAWI
jgi:fatty acid desaturase